ncbi:hypothetical protein CL617_03210 [archaeon]|nr:hypothetical protein [archaeon]
MPKKRKTKTKAKPKRKIRSEIKTKDKTRIKIEDLLASHTEGLTIQEIMDKTKLARHTVLARLHALVGEGNVNVRKINMAKLHYLNEDVLSKEEDLEENPIKEKIDVQPIKEDHIKEPLSKKNVEETPKIDMSKIKEEIENELKTGKLDKNQAQIKEQREPLTHVVDSSKHLIKGKTDEFIRTGVPGFDDLFGEGIPKGSAVLLAGGAGNGKTILSLQILYNHAMNGKKCLYMSFEESEEKLTHHMEDFGWDTRKLIKDGNLMIKRFNPFDITRSVDALLMKAKGELLIEIDPIIFPGGFEPDIIVVDSLTAIASAFTGKEDSYRIYIEQLFRFFEKIKATSFLITETKQIPTVFSQTGVEEFLADGVIVLYNIKRSNVRKNAIEILKLRGAQHQKKIVAMQITNKGIVVYPEQEVFSEI